MHYLSPAHLEGCHSEPNFIGHKPNAQLHRNYSEYNFFEKIAKELFRQEDTARYVGLFVAPAEGFGRGFFFALRAKKRANFAVLDHFWQFLVSRSNLGNF